MPIPTLKAHQVDYSRFILFHPNANGDNGRPVFIDPELIVRFMELVDISDALGRDLAGEIITKLKAVAGGSTSDSNLSNASQHRDYFVSQNVYVTYTILQSSPISKKSAVYITDLERALKTEAQGGPGLYNTSYSAQRGRDWKPNPSTDTTMPTTLGAIGALKPNAQAETSVDNTAVAFGRYLAAKDMKRLGGEYSLFYTPSYVIDQYGKWIGAAQKTGKEKGSPKALAQLMLNTENNLWSQTTHRYCWYVFGDGAKQLLTALGDYHTQQKYPLGRHHEFVFIDPKVPLGQLKSQLQQVGIELTPDMVKLEGADLATKMHVIADASDTYQSFLRSPDKQRQLDKVATAAKAQFAKRTPNIYFVDIVKGLEQSLSGGWI